MPKKVKYKSAEEKRKAMEAEKQWQAMSKQYNLGSKPDNSKSLKTMLQKKSYTPPKPAYRGSDSKPPSLTTTTKGGGARVETPKYTGSVVIGISTLHKSNAVPIINQEQATEISRMRRG